MTTIGTHLANTGFTICERGPADDALALVHTIYDGIRLEEVVKQKIRAGTATVDDIRPPEI
jgi:hypothetical protein